MIKDNTTQENQSFVALHTLVVADGEEDGTGLDVDGALGDSRWCRRLRERTMTVPVS